MFSRNAIPQPRAALRAVTAITLLASLMAVGGCGNSLPPQSDWKPYSSPDGRVSVRFPGTPKTQEHSVQSPLGPLKFTLTGYESKQGAFMINHLTYPVNPAEYDVQAGLEGACSGAASNVGGTILEKTEIELAGFPGRAILVQTGQGALVRARVYIDPAGPTLFQIQCVGKRNLVDSADATAFLDSLQIK